MCIICVDFQKQLLTINEARGILSEMSSTIERKHLTEIKEMLEEAENESD
jgi:hypothetical protein